jgi:predicted nucleic acid-binding protein
MTSPLLVLDTGVIYAVADASDDYHDACDELVANFAGDLVVPTPVVVEAAWLTSRAASALTQKASSCVR